MTKPIVAYFSVTGITKAIAKKIAQASDGELFPIIPEVRYTTEDIRWQNKNARASVEQNSETIRPGIAKYPNLDQVDTIFLGFPIWWHTYPKIILTFIENLNLNNKTLIPFATSGGSGIEKAQKSLKQLLPDTKVLDGKVFNNNPPQSEIDNWVNSLKIN